MLPPQRDSCSGPRVARRDTARLGNFYLQGCQQGFWGHWILAADESLVPGSWAGDMLPLLKLIFGRRLLDELRKKQKNKKQNSGEDTSVVLSLWLWCSEEEGQVSSSWKLAWLHWSPGPGTPRALGLFRTKVACPTLPEPCSTVQAGACLRRAVSLSAC